LVPASFLFLLSSSILEGAGSGWTVYPPLSLRDFSSSYSIDLAIFSLHVAGASSIIASINFLATILKARVGFNASQIVLFIWASAVTAVILILAVPVFAGGLTILLTDRNFNTSFFLVEGGGDVILFQHLF
jgi:heme/copper-type cytochrome/quinol oxidase subunit 1